MSTAAVVRKIYGINGINGIFIQYKTSFSFTKKIS